MSVDFASIRDYLKGKDKDINLQVYIYSLVIGVLVILTIISMIFIKKNIYYTNNMIVRENRIITNVNYQDINYIISNQEIIINNNHYKYDISDIILVDENSFYYRVELLINLGKYRINNNILEYQILLNEESMWQYFVRIIKGG